MINYVRVGKNICLMLETAIGSSFKLNQGIGLEIGIVLQLGNLTTYHFFLTIQISSLLNLYQLCRLLSYLSMVASEDFKVHLFVGK